MKKLLLFILLHPFLLSAQDHTIDSLKSVLKNAKHDTARVKLLLELSEICEVKNILEFAEPCVRICEMNLANISTQNNNTKHFYSKYLAGSLNNIGIMYSEQGDVDKALEFHKKTLRIYTTIKDKTGVANSYINLGTNYNNKGDIRLALEYFFKGLKIYEEINNNDGIANTLNNISVVYRDQKDYQKAIEYCNKSLLLNTKTNNTKRIGYALSNLGSYYDDLNDTQQALDYYNKSLKIQEKDNNKYGIAYCFNNIGSMHSRIGDFQNALNYYNKSLEIFEEIEDMVGITMSLNNKGRALLKIGKLNEANRIANRSLQIAIKLGNPDRIKHSANTLKDIYIKQKKHKEALEMYELEMQMRDSINNSETKKASIKKQFQYQYEKKAAADSVKNTEEQKVKNALLTAQQAQIKQERTKSYTLYGGLALVMIFAGFMVNRFRVTNKQKEIIELKEIETQKQNEIITHQKQLVEEKHKEITDSINYAERIQRSFLATKEILENNLSVRAESRTENSYFVYFQPKDIVSGDFYWASQLSNGNFALATADSTGHGVPGAIMSILNISCLEKAVEQEKLTEPAEILNHTRTKIIERLKKDGSEEGGKDGMDCSLACFDFKNNKLTYAAANNPVWIVRNVSSSEVENKKELIELPSDKMPVGKHDKDNIPFRQHSIQLQKGDVVYTLTDGLPDQFGGPKGKKFMYRQLKELLTSIAHLSIPEQKEILKTSLNNWKGELEQVDDICVIGIRI